MPKTHFKKSFPNHPKGTFENPKKKPYTPFEIPSKQYSKHLLTNPK
jgi:hypothetical protein